MDLLHGHRRKMRNNEEKKREIHSHRVGGHAGQATRRIKGLETSWLQLMLTYEAWKRRWKRRRMKEADRNKRGQGVVTWWVRLMR